MRIYVVGQDKDTGLYYVHRQGYPSVPCIGTFTRKRSEARKQAAEWTGLSTKEYGSYIKSHANAGGIKG